jgi:hypothetical protein
MVECADSSKSALNQKARVVNQVNENEDEQTDTFSKVVGKMSAEKGISELTVYELDGEESATKPVKLKCVKIEPKDSAMVHLLFC